MQGEFRDPLCGRVSSLSALFARVPTLLKYRANSYRQARYYSQSGYIIFNGLRSFVIGRANVVGHLTML